MIIEYDSIREKLLNEVESDLNSIGCKAILLEVFGYNINAINFYNKNGYNFRIIDMIKIND